MVVDFESCTRARVIYLPLLCAMSRSFSFSLIFYLGLLVHSRFATKIINSDKFPFRRCMMRIVYMPIPSQSIKSGKSCLTISYDSAAPLPMLLEYRLACC